MAYDAAADALVWGRRDSLGPTFRIWRYDMRTGAWGQGAPSSSPYLFFGYGPLGAEITFDEDLGRIVIVAHGTVVSLNGSTGAWEALRLGPGTADPVTRLDQAAIFDPVNHRYVVLGGSRLFGGPIGWAKTDDVIAFDPSTRSWLELLRGVSVQSS